MDDAKVAHRIRGKVTEFSGKVSQGLPKTARRLVREVVYGIQSRGSVRLSEIARSLEEKTAMKKIIERLSRQLKRPGLREQVTENLLDLAAKRMGEETLLVVDPTDISKPYARKMEYLARVRDGSAGGIRDGYWCCQVVATRRGSREVRPLYQELYSQEAPDFESENEEILKAIEKLGSKTGAQGTWVMDRGGDRKEIILPLLRWKCRFLIRLRGDRHLVVRRSPKRVEEIAARCRLAYRETVIKETQDGEEVYPLDFGGCVVRFPGFDRKLFLVVVEGFGEKPLLLLTTMPIKKSRKSVWRVVESYLARWRVEETIRFIKQSYQLEDIRLLTYERLRNMAGLVMATAYFACVYLEKSIKLRILVHHIHRAAKRIYGIPEFRYYALADGIKQILYSRTARIRGPIPDPSDVQSPLLPLTL
jgi:hypothetical protein